MKMNLKAAIVGLIGAILSSAVFAADLPIEAPQAVPQQVTIYTLSAIKPKLLKQLLSSEQIVSALADAGCKRTHPNKALGSSVSYACDKDDGDSEKALKGLLLPGTSLTTKTIVQLASSTTCPSGCAYIKTCCNNVSYCCCQMASPTQRCAGYSCP